MRLSSLPYLWRVQMAGRKPNFLIVGAAKTGTTSIFEYLKQHPDIFLPTKETFHFISEIYRGNNLPYPAQRPHEEIVFDEAAFLGAYEAAGDQTILGEIATGYLYYPEIAIPNIKKMLGDDLYMVAVLRNPVGRTYSGYTFFSRDLHEKLSFEDALAAEKERTEANWDFMWHYVAHSKYADSVKAYQDAFPNLKVMFFDDLKEDPAAFMKELYEYLGVDPEVDMDLSMKNVSGAPKSKVFQTLITQENPIKKLFRPLLRAFFGREARHRIRQWLKARNVGDRDSITNEQYNALLPEFEEDVKKLERLTGRDLSSWREPRS